MSKLICSAAIRGAHKIVARAEQKWREAMDRWGAKQEVGFPNTAYYLPIIYGITGIAVKTLGDMEQVLKLCRRLLPPPVREKVHLPYLAPALDAGMATFFAEEIIEAIKYLENPNMYVASAEEPTDENIWLGAADDIIMRKRGVEFVDGTAPGFAAILGAPPDVDTAVRIARELQEKNLYVFMCSDNNGVRMAEQLVEAGVQIGWTTRLVPFGPDTSATVFSIGFATRVAMAFGGIKPGEYRRILIYNKDRVFAFVLALGFVTDEWYANAAGAINWGFPTIADTPIPQVLPTGICTYEHVVSNVPHSEIVSKAIEVRGLKVTVTKVPVPVAYGPAFEGERVRKADLYVEFGGNRSLALELCRMRRMDEVQDGKIEIVGPDIDTAEEGGAMPLAILVEIAGRRMQEDFEPILERQIHHFINYAQGIFHMGQRDIVWLRISKGAFNQGFRLRHIGEILHARFHQDFGNILDKVQITIFTNEEDVRRLLDEARAIYHARDARMEGMRDEDVDIFYSCVLCQSFAPTHVCVISPERPGLCGAYTWLDAKAMYEVNPEGPNQPVQYGECIDPLKGAWKGVNEFVKKASRGAIDGYNFYSVVDSPMTTCGCCECITAVLPLCNGVMTVNREYMGMTPCGMKFTTLAGTIGGGVSTPGFVGHAKIWIVQRKWLQGDGGIKRLVWMPKMLKEELGERLVKRLAEVGMSVDMIADETVGTTEEEILPYLQEKGHPALEMPPIIG